MLTLYLSLVRMLMLADENHICWFRSARLLADILVLLSCCSKLVVFVVVVLCRVAWFPFV